MSKTIFEGRLRENDCAPRSGRTIVLEDKDQNGQPFSFTIQQLFRKHTPFDPEKSGKRVRITIEQFEN